MILCACGCKTKIDPKDIYGRPKKFVWGHNGKLLPRSGKNIPCNVCGKFVYRKMKEFKKSKHFFCSMRCHAHFKASLIGEKSPSWKGGRNTTASGHIRVYKPGHKNANDFLKRYVPEHRFVMSEFLGRPLKKIEIVHHLNGNKRDNRITNLKIVSRAEHERIHKPRLKK